MRLKRVILLALWAVSLPAACAGIARVFDVFTGEGNRWAALGILVLWLMVSGVIMMSYPGESKERATWNRPK